MNNTSFHVNGHRLIKDPVTFGKDDKQVTVVTVAINPIGKKAEENGYRSFFVDIKCGGWKGEAARKLAKGDTCTAWGSLVPKEYVKKDGTKALGWEMPFPEGFVGHAKAADAPTEEAAPEAPPAVAADPFDFK